uniref:Macro domain-containing protein n=1 Tax=Panagrolaimus sp. ES5 TaxID=591445 RepID=A0AC34FUG1_9BILA
MADIIVHEIQHKNVKIACKAGNITRSTAEVALVSSTPQYPMDVGASKAIALAGGQTFHERRLVAIDYARNNDESYITIDTEDIVEIPFKYVIVIPVRGRNRSSMRVIYRQAIKAAIDSEMSSVVMPLLGCGGLNIQVNRATQELLEAILTFSSFGNLTAISFIDINVQSMERLGQLFDTIPSMLPDP